MHKTAYALNLAFIFPKFTHHILSLSLSAPRVANSTQSAKCGAYFTHKAFNGIVCTPALQWQTIMEIYTEIYTAI